MAEKLIRKYYPEIKRKANVIGCDLQLRKRRRKGKIVDELCFVVFVKKKIPLARLAVKDIIPKTLEGVPVDVIETGVLKAPPKFEIRKRRRKKRAVDKTGKFRPLVAGISTGHVQITAGTLGWFVEKNDQILPASNAHVFTPDPSLETFLIDEILQPGDVNGGTEVVGDYLWHDVIRPMSQCQFANGVVDILNNLAKTLKRRSRFQVQEVLNHQDFAVMLSEVALDRKFADVKELPEPFLGFGFAGSDTTSTTCKIDYAMAHGYRPCDVEVYKTLQVGDTVAKTGRTSCFTKAQVISTSARLQVSYGIFIAEFSDVVLTTKLLDPGDSGSAVWIAN